MEKIKPHEVYDELDKLCIYIHKTNTCSECPLMENCQDIWNSAYEYLRKGDI